MRDERTAAEPATVPGHSVTGLRVRGPGRVYVSRFPALGPRSAERRTPYLPQPTAGQPPSGAEHACSTSTQDGLRRAESVRRSAVTGFLGPDRRATGYLYSVTRGTTVALSVRLNLRKSGGASAHGTARQRPHAAEGRIHPARIQATGSLVPAENCRFVRGSATRNPAPWRRRLTIRWRVTILRWMPDHSDTVVARGVVRRARDEPVVRREIAGPARSGRCAEGHSRGPLMAALTFRVMNAISASRWGFAERPSFGAFDPASRWSIRRRPTADRRSPVRWRTVAE